MSAILDGKPVDASVIDPAKHKYIGMWRPPEPPQERCDFSLPRLDAMVAWNNNLRSQDAWRKGELDVAQYVTISVLNDRVGPVPRGNERRFVRGIPLFMAQELQDAIGRDGKSLRNGDFFEYRGKRYIALRDEFLATDGSDC